MLSFNYVIQNFKTTITSASGIKICLFEYDIFKLTFTALGKPRQNFNDVKNAMKKNVYCCIVMHYKIKVL